MCVAVTPRLQHHMGLNIQYAEEIGKKVGKNSFMLQEIVVG